MRVDVGDTVYVVDWGNSDEGLETYKVLEFFESSAYGPAAHLIGASGTRVGQYRSIPLENLRKLSRLEKRGRGKWCIITPEGKEMEFTSKEKAITAAKKRGLLVKEN